MFNKYLFSLFAIAYISSAVAERCEHPKVEAQSYTSSDATVVTQIAFITEFTLQCDNPLPENYALYAEVEGKPLTAARIGPNKYQFSWTEEPSKARAGVYNIFVVDEEGWALMRRARRSDTKLNVAPLLAIELQHAGSYSGPWVNSEVLATAISIIVAYLALRNKSKILA